jgi:hypothetical protein
VPEHGLLQQQLSLWCRAHKSSLRQHARDNQRFRGNCSLVLLREKEAFRDTRRQYTCDGIVKIQDSTLRLTNCKLYQKGYLKLSHWTLPQQLAQGKGENAILTGVRVEQMYDKGNTSANSPCEKGGEVTAQKAFGIDADGITSSTFLGESRFHNRSSVLFISILWILLSLVFVAHLLCIVTSVDQKDPRRTPCKHPFRPAFFSRV